MNVRFRRSVCALALLLCSVFTAFDAAAATISFSGTSSDGHAVSGKADFTAGAGTVTVVLTNTTPTTLDAGELFTGLDFSLGGLTPSLTSKTGIERSVNGSGVYTDTGSAQNLSWSLVSLGGSSFQLNFNPDAKDAIIGPPSGGTYSGANGSIKSNNGHDPFAAQSATFVLSVPGATTNTALTASTFRFGTTLDPATGTSIVVPEPTACVLLLIGLLSFVVKRTR